MTNEQIGRLILEAHAGMHGDVAKQITDAMMTNTSIATDVLVQACHGASGRAGWC